MSKKYSKYPKLDVFGNVRFGHFMFDAGVTLKTQTPAQNTFYRCLKE